VNPYTGLHAEVYDELYADKPYEAEARFVHDLAGAPGGKLLDVACGTGRHARAFADLGYEVTAVDINEELLSVGRASVGDRVRFLQGDMTQLAVDGRPFDLVTCLFDSIGYAVENDRVVAALRSLARHAAPGGVVVVEFLHAPAIVVGASPVGVKRRELADGRRLLRTSEVTLDLVRMAMEVHYELWLAEPDGTTRYANEVQTNRFFAVPEMRLLVDEVGLRTRSILPAYADGPIDRDVFHLILVAEPST
jgi:SAM-dependent methyltransferase